MSTKTRPFLKWAGNKYRCLHHIISSLTPASRLIEPFSGSAAVFLNTDYPCYLLAEANQDLIVLFRTLQQEGESFIQYCKSFFTPANNNSEVYYHNRHEFNHITNSRTKSALFLYLNRHGYNGLCRYNKKGQYNVPFGLYKKPYFPENEMRVFHKKSQHAEFIHNDFEKTFELAKPGDIIYCDPPYAPIAQSSNFSAYTGKAFSEMDQIKLAELAVETAKQGITVLISNHNTEFTRCQYQQADIRSFYVKRSINCDSDNRNSANELIAIFKPR